MALVLTIPNVKMDQNNGQVSSYNLSLLVMKGLRCAYCQKIILPTGRREHLQSCELLLSGSEFRKKELDTKTPFELIFVQAHPYSELTWIRPAQPLVECEGCNATTLYEDKVQRFHRRYMCSEEIRGKNAIELEEEFKEWCASRNEISVAVWDVCNQKLKSNGN